MKLIAVLAATAVLAGCATQTGADWVPIVDMRTGQSDAYVIDLASCQGYARQTASAAQSAATGAVAGAIFGALVGAAFKVNRGEMAKFGAISGGVGAAGRAEESQRSIISRCLAGRGYSVLN